MLMCMLILVNTTIFENFKKSIQNKQICIFLDLDIQTSILINAHVYARKKTKNTLKYVYLDMDTFYGLHLIRSCCRLWTRLSYLWLPVRDDDWEVTENTFPLELLTTIKFLQTFLWVYSGYRKNLSIKVMML